MTVNFSRQEWYFENEPAKVYRFQNQPLDPVFHLNVIENTATRNLSSSFVSIDESVAETKLDDARPANGLSVAKATRDRKTKKVRLSKSDPLICCGLNELSSREDQILVKFLKKHITGDPDKPGATNLTEHRIDVAGHRPIKQRYYPVSPKIQEAIYAEVDKMLAAKIIEPSKSEWSSPIVMIKKPNGSYRFCLDFRKLNNVSKKDAYPLPYMNAILDKLRSASYISTIDLSQAYFQIPLERNSRELTAFTVPGKGLFHFTRMPYGLTGAPATFQRLLDRLIGPEMESHAFAYLDDIVVVTRTFDEHLIWLKRVLDRIREAGLTINPEKSKFCRSQVKYLGFLIQQEGLKVDPDKTAPIVEYPPPKNIKQLRRFIGMASWALSEAEKKYSTTEQECLAVVWSIKKFRPYLEGYNFKVITDHSSLRWLHNLKNPTGRLARWALELLEYDYKIEHRKGALHHVPDALSRMYEDTAELCAVAITGDAWYDARVRSVENEPRKNQGWKINNDQLYFRKPSAVVSQVVDDLEQWKLVLPREARVNVLREAHNTPQAGHLGVEKTYQRVATRYFWPRMFKEVAGYVRHCDVCQRTKVEQNVPMGLMGRRAVETPWTVVATDIMGPFPPSKNGNAYILVMQDLFTKWIECCPLRKATGKKIRELLTELIVNRWGAPRVLLTDNGTEFINRELQAFAEEHGITHTTVPPYHPQANPVERVNRVIKTMITAFLESDHREWDLHLAEFRFAYNTAYHTSLHATPAFLNFGREPQPINTVRGGHEQAVEVAETNPASWKERMERIKALREWIIENLEAAHEKQSRYYNLRRRDQRFAIGERVLKRQHILSSAAQNISAKLATKFHGPFTIAKILSPVVYELRDDAGRSLGKVHIKDLKLYNVPHPTLSLGN
ncbi:uncharacterized protein K02A2.6-like [Camponotus floridanus]|uniref:uncharacterized protein K02A2.6-like n=1 Tax=Camponotus floridanus TaxID=104421 RepID=UPI000DC6675A|nr:uncharacterized protein K02A2.6-like [Camponotus floridanus]